MRLEPVSQRFLAIGGRQRTHARCPRFDLTPQCVDSDELFRRQGSLGEAHKRRQQHIAGVLQRPNRTHSRGRRVVDLVSQTCRQRAESGERLPLARKGFHVAHRLEEALDQVHAEREPGEHPFPQRLGGDSQHDARAGPAAGRQVPGLVRPCAEAPRPDSRPVHHPGDRFLPSRAAQQLHPPFQQYPPEVSGLTLTEQHIAAVEAHLITGRDQLMELLVAEPLEQEDVTQTVNEHQPNLPSAASGSAPGGAQTDQDPAAQQRRTSRAIASGETAQPSPTIIIADFATPRAFPSPCPVEATRVAAGQCGSERARGRRLPPEPRLGRRATGVRARAGGFPVGGVHSTGQAQSHVLPGLSGHGKRTDLPRARYVCRLCAQP